MTKLLWIKPLPTKRRGVATNNLPTQKSVWKEILPPGTKAWWVNDRELAWLQPNGRLVIRSLENDQILLQTQLEAEPTLQALYVLRSQHQYFGIRSYSRNKSHARVDCANSSSCCYWFSRCVAPLPCCSQAKCMRWSESRARCSGQPLWQFHKWVFPLDQPLEQPVLVFHRNMEATSGGSARESMSSLLCIDKRTGALLYHAAKIENAIHDYSLEVDAEQQP